MWRWRRSFDPVSCKFIKRKSTAYNRNILYLNYVCWNFSHLLRFALSMKLFFFIALYYFHSKLQILFILLRIQYESRFIPLSWHTNYTLFIFCFTCFYVNQTTRKKSLFFSVDFAFLKKCVLKLTSTCTTECMRRLKQRKQAFQSS